jgi:hypothetical protein
MRWSQLVAQILSTKEDRQMRAFLLIFRYCVQTIGTALKPRPHRADNRLPFYTGFNSNSFRSVMSKAILEAPTILPAESLTGEMDKDTFLFLLSFLRPMVS